MQHIVVMNITNHHESFISNMNNTSIQLNESFKHDDTAINTRLERYQYSLFLTNIVICIINLVGNVTVLIMIGQRRLLGRTTNVFVFSLAMADVLCCLGAIPYLVFSVIEIEMSVYLCKFYYYTLCVSRAAVSYTIVLLTTEKILNILHPSRFITAGRCMFFISLVWFFSTAYNVWTVVFYTIYDSDKVSLMELIHDPSIGMYGKECFFSNRFKSLRRIFLSLDLTVLFIGPCGILILQLLVIVRKQHGSIKQRFETYFYIMRFLFFIFFVFLTCHTPFEIAIVVRNGISSSAHTNRFYDASTTIYYTRGVANLAVYIYFKQYVCRRKRKLSTASSRHKQNLEIPDRRAFRGMSMNELKVKKVIGET